MFKLTPYPWGELKIAGEKHQKMLPISSRRMIGYTESRVLIPFETGIQRPRASTVRVFDEGDLQPQDLSSLELNFYLRAPIVCVG